MKATLTYEYIPVGPNIGAPVIMLRPSAYEIGQTELLTETENALRDFKVINKIIVVNSLEGNFHVDDYKEILDFLSFFQQRNVPASFMFHVEEYPSYAAVTGYRIGFASELISSEIRLAELHYVPDQTPTEASIDAKISAGSYFVHSTASLTKMDAIEFMQKSDHPWRLGAMLKGPKVEIL